MLDVQFVMLAAEKGENNFEDLQYNEYLNNFKRTFK